MNIHSMRYYKIRNGFSKIKHEPDFNRCNYATIFINLRYNEHLKIRINLQQLVKIYWNVTTSFESTCALSRDEFQ